MLKNYFKIAVRNLARNKVYSGINIIGLSLGLACAMLILLYTSDELSYDRFHNNADNIYQVAAKRFNPDGSVWLKTTSSGIFQGPRFTANIPEIRAYTRVQKSASDFKLGNDIVSRELLQVDPSFFSVFSFPFIDGDRKTALNNPNSIVISQKIAREYFGNTNAIGKILQIKKGDEFEPYIVTGITRATPQNSSIKFDILMPLVISEKRLNNNESWMNFHLNTFVVLNDNANVAVVNRKMNETFNREASETLKSMAEKFGNNVAMEQLLVPFVSIHLNTEFSADNALKDASKPIYSYVLSGIALFVLLIACINFINLTIARSVKRAKEIGIRKVVGGERKQLIVQFLGESFLLCICAFIFAIVLVQLSLPTFNELSNKALAISYLFNAKMIAGFIALFIVTSLLAGFYPALVLSSFRPVKVLYSRFNLAGRNYLQKSLVVLQFSLATLLVIATIIVHEQFTYLTSKELGYDDNDVVMVEKPNLTHEQAKLFREQLLSNPNITAVAMKNRGREGTMARVTDKKEVGFDYELIDANYLSLYKIPIVKGRNFSAQIASDSTNAVMVNEAFVRNAGWTDPIGQEIDFFYDKKKYTVIGVVKDYHYRSLNEEIGSQVFHMRPDKPYGNTMIRIKPKTETASLQFIEATYKKLFPLNPYTYKFREAENLRAYESEARWKQMMFSAALLTIFISCIGLFGLSVLAVEKRTKEIGIRKVLGASVSSVVTTLSKDFLKLVFIAMIIAMPAAWYFTSEWLANYPYRIALSWQMFTIAGLLVLMVALVTVSFQAIKAAIANPVKSLRTE